MNAAAPAFLTSVTTPSLTSPAATNLTLAGGAGNSSVILTPAGTGNVGIGTVTPGAKLAVVGTTNSARLDVARLYNLGSGIGAGAALGFVGAGGDVSPAYIFAPYGSHGDASNSVALQFATGGGTSSANADGTVRMTISGLGNVGIGETSPAHTLSLKTATSTYIKLAADFGDGYVGMETVDDTFRFVTGQATPIVFYTNNTARATIGATGIVSITNSTAGSASAGALVVTGGLSAGNNGGASYFGGVITATGDRPFQSVNDGKTWIVGPSTDGNFYITQVGVGSLRVSHTSGNVAILGTISPQQATTASAPAYVKGAIYFDTTLNKLRVGGATAYETITSV
jgi:hypothetical protein